MFLCEICWWDEGAAGFKADGGDKPGGTDPGSDPTLFHRIGATAAGHKNTMKKFI